MTSQAAAAAPLRVFPGTGSLVSEAEIEALRPGHTLPWDPAAAGRYLAGRRRRLARGGTRLGRSRGRRRRGPALQGRR